MIAADIGLKVIPEKALALTPPFQVDDLCSGMVALVKLLPTRSQTEDKLSLQDSDTVGPWPLPSKDCNGILGLISFKLLNIFSFKHLCVFFHF